jgi:hypothetical protein
MFPSGQAWFLEGESLIFQKCLSWQQGSASMAGFDPIGQKIEVNSKEALNLSRADSSFFQEHLTKHLGFVKLESMRLKFESSTPIHQ